MRVAINGFGRIGRQIFIAGLNESEIEFVAVNDVTEPKVLAYLLKYDSVYGRFNGTIEYNSDGLIVNGKFVKVLAERDPEKLPWKSYGIDIVIESTGFFADREGASKHLKAGAKKVLVSTTMKDADLTLVKGVNENMYDRNKHHIVSNATCTTNCLAPVVKVLNDNFQIIHGFMTTVHAYTSDQRLIDGPGDVRFKDTSIPALRRGRAAAQNLVITTTGAAKTVAQVIPELRNKLDGIAIRAPVLCGSVSDFVCEVRKYASKEQVNWLFSEVSKYHLKGIIQYTEDPIVSTDIIHNSHSAIFDAQSTMVIDGTLIKVLAWYDNEWGYACRCIDVIKFLL